MGKIQFDIGVGIITFLSGIFSITLDDLAKIISLLTAVAGLAYIIFNVRLAIRREKREIKEFEMNTSGEYQIIKKQQKGLEDAQD